MQRIEHRLREVMGLNSESIGTSSLQRIIRLRMKAAGVGTIDDYERVLNSTATEWNQLVEAVVVTETWFFRDRQAFAALAGMILTEWLPRHPTGRCQILSLPCSSGEEPCSIVMGLLDAGLPAGRFAVTGVDLSERALERAAGGCYGKNSFRGQDLSFRDRYFKREGDAYRIRQSVRDCVDFRQANLLGENFSLSSARYDYIFCRNLLIYFDRATQRQAFARLDAMLVSGGTLFVGPAEAPLAYENGFSTVNLPMAFACRRIGATSAVKRPVAPSRSHKRAMASSDSRAHTKSATEIPPTANQTSADALAAAHALANGGRLEEATRLCHAHLDRHGVSSEAFYLLGVIHDAQGKPAARDFYRKALYLDPNHQDTLLQMALLAEKEGDMAAARNLRRRARKLQTQG